MITTAKKLQLQMFKQHRQNTAGLSLIIQECKELNQIF